MVSTIFIYFAIFNSSSNNKISEQKIYSGTSVGLAPNQKATFDINNESHSLTVVSVNSNSVDLVIESNRIELNIKVGEEKKIDLNNDGIYDLKIRFDGFINGKAQIYTIKISEPVNSGISQANQANNTNVQICTQNWDCSSWSDCNNGQQTRTCSDLNNCGTTNNRPSISRGCNIVNNSVNSSVSTSINIDAEWNVFQEYKQALQNKDLAKYNSLSYKQVPQSQWTDGSINFLLNAISIMNKSDFVNVQRDSRQSIIWTNWTLSEDSNAIGYDASYIYFIKNSSGSLLVLAPQPLVGASHTKINTNLNSVQIKQFLQDYLKDSDGDGLSDSNEKCLDIIGDTKPGCVQTNPNNKDSDGDGWWDGTEVQAGTDPNNASDYPFKATTTNQTYICSDSDGGNVPDVQGTVTYTNPGQPQQTKTDTCTDSTTLTEYFCYSQSDAMLWGTAYSQTFGISCTSEGKVCSNGACVAPSASDYGSINVTSSVAGATVNVDYQNVGVTPIIINNLLQGNHYVQVSKSGCISVVGRNYAVNAGQITQINIPLAC